MARQGEHEVLQAKEGEVHRWAASALELKRLQNHHLLLLLRASKGPLSGGRESYSLVLSLALSSP